MTDNTDTVLAKMEEWCEAVAVEWGHGSQTHNVARDAVDIVHAALRQPTQSEDKCVECNGNGYTEIIGGYQHTCEVCYGEGFLRQPTQSDAAQEYGRTGYCMGYEGFERFIIPAPKPDPLVEAIAESDDNFDPDWDYAPYADALRAALEARGLEIREKNDD